MRYSNVLRLRIQTLRQAGHSIRSIAKLVGKDPRNISTHLRTFAGRDILAKAPGKRRPRKLSQRDVSVIKRLLLSGEFDNVASIARQLPQLGLPQVGESTIREALHREGFRAKIKAKKPYLSARHRHARLQYARAHRDWTVQDWKKVIFSDETKVSSTNDAGRTWVWFGPETDPIRRPSHSAYQKVQLQHDGVGMYVSSRCWKPMSHQ